MKWEYKVVIVNDDDLIESTMNNLGEHDWELVTVYTEYRILALYFKRPKTVDNYGK